MDKALEAKRTKHGRMELVRFDVEGYALCRCPICGREIGLYVGACEDVPLTKIIEQGDFFARHEMPPLSDVDLSVGVGAAPACALAGD